MGHPVEVNGAILNMGAHHGMTVDKTLEMLAEAKRIHTGNKPPWTVEYKNLPEKAELHDQHPLFHASRHRIRIMEKAIADSAQGRTHGLKRKKWRRNGNDADVILDVLGHVLSRPDPETHEEIVEDALHLLLRTGELRQQGHSKIANVPPVPRPDIAPLMIKTDGSLMLTLGDTCTEDYTIKFGRGHTTTRITIGLENNFPATVFESLQARIASRLGQHRTVRHIQNLYNGSGLEEIEAHHFIDWKALHGPMKCWLVDVRQEDNPFRKDKTDMVFEIVNGTMQ